MKIKISLWRGDICIALKIEGEMLSYQEGAMPGFGIGLAKIVHPLKGEQVINIRKTGGVISAEAPAGWAWWE